MSLPYTFHLSGPAFVCTKFEPWQNQMNLLWCTLMMHMQIGWEREGSLLSCAPRAPCWKAWVPMKHPFLHQPIAHQKSFVQLHALEVIPRDSFHYCNCPKSIKVHFLVLQVFWWNLDSALVVLFEDMKHHVPCSVTSGFRSVMDCKGCRLSKPWAT